MANSANERKKSKPDTPPRSPPNRKYRTTSPAKTRVATIIANAAETIEPHKTARRPARLASTADASACAPPPTFNTSAQAGPSGYGRSDWVTSARRSGIEYITPSIPPRPQIQNDTQYGKPVHQPIITKPGSTKIIEDKVPAADATVWTILFSWIVIPLKLRSTAIEITAAGIDVANVRPAFRPKYTLAAVNTMVMTKPRIRPRRVNSVSESDSSGFLFTK